MSSIVENNLVKEKEFIDKVVEELFKKISKEFHLKTGDIHPNDEIRTDSFKNLLLRYIKNNRTQEENLLAEGFRHAGNDIYLKECEDGIFLFERLDEDRIAIDLNDFSLEDIRSEVSEHINSWGEFDENNKKFIALCIYENKLGYGLLTLDALEMNVLKKYKENFEGMKKSIKENIISSKAFIIKNILYFIKQVKGKKFMFYSEKAPTEDDIGCYLESKDFIAVNNFYNFLKISKSDFEELDLISKINYMIEYFNYLEIDENSRQLNCEHVVKKINLTLSLGSVKPLASAMGI